MVYTLEQRCTWVLTFAMFCVLRNANASAPRSTVPLLGHGRRSPNSSSTACWPCRPQAAASSWVEAGPWGVRQLPAWHRRTAASTASAARAARDSGKKRTSYLRSRQRPRRSKSRNWRQRYTRGPREAHPSSLGNPVFRLGRGPRLTSAPPPPVPWRPGGSEVAPPSAQRLRCCGSRRWLAATVRGRAAARRPRRRSRRGARRCRRFVLPARAAAAETAPPPQPRRRRCRQCCRRRARRAPLAKSPRRAKRAGPLAPPAGLPRSTPCPKPAAALRPLAGVLLGGRRLPRATTAAGRTARETPPPRAPPPPRPRHPRPGGGRGCIGRRPRGGSWRRARASQRQGHPATATTNHKGKSRKPTRVSM